MSTQKFPSIHSQGYKTRAIAKDRLLPSGGNRHFNASILRTERGSLIMAYRYHGPDRGRSLIAICDLDTSYNPTSNNVVPLIGPTNMEHFEDPRLIEHKGDVWMSYIEASGYGGAWKCSMRLVKLKREQNDWVVDRKFTLPYGLNDLAQEKNWSFFSHREKLYFVYSLKPHVVVEIDDTTGLTGREWVTPGIVNWQHGTLSGGTPPINYSGTLLAMFHSALPHPQRVRRYNASLYMFSPEPPFEIRQVTKPVLYGSDEDGFMPDPRDHGIKWEPCVVFPCGRFMDSMSNLIVSCGINDHGIVIVDLPVDKMNWHNPVFISGKHYFFTSNATRPIEMPSGPRIEWEPTRQVAGSWEGVMATDDPKVIAMMAERDGADESREISDVDYAVQLSNKR